MHFYRHYNSPFLFSFILFTKFFVSPRKLTLFIELFTNHSPGHVTIRHIQNGGQPIGCQKIFIFMVITAFPGLFMHSFCIILLILSCQSIMCNIFHCFFIFITHILLRNIMVFTTYHSRFFSCTGPFF